MRGEGLRKNNGAMRMSDPVGWRAERNETVDHRRHTSPTLTHCSQPHTYSTPCTPTTPHTIPHTYDETPTPSSPGRILFRAICHPSRRTLPACVSGMSHEEIADGPGSPSAMSLHWLFLRLFPCMVGDSILSAASRSDQRSATDGVPLRDNRSAFDRRAVASRDSDQPFVLPSTHTDRI